MSVVPLQGSKGDRGVRGPRGRVGAGVSERWDDRGGNKLHVSFPTL